MSNNTKAFSIPFVLYLVVLLGLIYMFRTELLVTGIRLYVTAVHNPKAEQLLGDYYQNNAQLSGELAKTFYGDAVKKYQDAVATTSGEQQALIKLRVGQMYLCGKGVEANSATAKQWLTEALALMKDADKSGPLANEIKQALTFANEGQAASNQNTFQPCRLQPVTDFFDTL